MREDLQGFGQDGVLEESLEAVAFRHFRFGAEKLGKKLFQTEEVQRRAPLAVVVHQKIHVAVASGLVAGGRAEQRQPGDASGSNIVFVLAQNADGVVASHGAPIFALPPRRPQGRVQSCTRAGSIRAQVSQIWRSNQGAGLILRVRSRARAAFPLLPGPRGC
jgi:hypothetical protein